MDLKTPGRDDSEEVKLYRRSDVDARKKGTAGAGGAASEEDELSAAICRGLGGKKNISDVDCCATRLRCTVHKSELVDDALLKSTGASGVVHKGNGVQVIYGPRVTVVKSNLEDYLETAPDEEYVPAGKAGAESAAPAEEKPAGKVVKSDIIYSPVNGTAADLSETPDEAFAGRMMGDGAMVIPEDGGVRAPEDGEVSFVFETKHAIGFETASGIAMLLHMGIDTVNLNGQGFEVFVNNGDKVKKGDLLMKMDLEFLKKNAPSLASPVLCTELSENQKIRLLKTGAVKAGDELYAVDTFEG
jgi:PTS system D-glucosamine-specific IIC component